MGLDHRRLKELEQQQAKRDWINASLVRDEIVSEPVVETEITRKPTTNDERYQMGVHWLGHEGIKLASSFAWNANQTAFDLVAVYVADQPKSVTGVSLWAGSKQLGYREFVPIQMTTGDSVKFTLTLKPKNLEAWHHGSEEEVDWL